jgi:hypothetical protein
VVQVKRLAHTQRRARQPFTRRCRTASYRHTPLATDTFRLSTRRPSGCSSRRRTCRA